MSRKTKRNKYVINEAVDDFSPPTENQTIVRLLSSRGNNLHEVIAPDQSTFLVSMPTRFRKNVWVKRGSYVLIEPIEEGDKVKGEIVRILTNQHIKYFKEDKVWPPEFDNDCGKEETNGGGDDLYVNTNLVQIDESNTREESSSDSE